MSRAGPKPIPLEARFWTKVNKTDTCWLWTGSKTAAGYGNIFYREAKTMVYAHRTSWEMVNGAIPSHLVIDHLCRVRHCVNPEHMELVTRAENNRRGLMAERKREYLANLTHCKRGHPMGEVNTHVKNDGRRHCRACQRELQRRKRVSQSQNLS